MLKVAVNDLKKSSISTSEAEDAGMFTVKDASKIYEDFKPWPALVMPYNDPFKDKPMSFKRDGEDMEFCCVRYYPEQKPYQGFTKKKTRRYDQPKNGGVHPYFPITENIDWVEVAEDVDIPVLITEGQKKALSACLAGIPTIGLQGVYNFSQDGELLPALDYIEWEGRCVYICYDSDAADNNNVLVAESRLATELSIKRFAEPRLVRLPPGPGNRKQGLDDFITAKGDNALFELLEKAPEMRKIDKEILRMNTEVAWISKEGLLLDLRSDTWLKKSNFTQGDDFSTRQIAVPPTKGSGIKYVSVAKAFLTHPHARRYTDTIFRPGTDEKAILMEGGGVAYNRFRGLRTAKGSVEPFFKLYNWLMSRTDEFEYDFVWKLVCYKAQNLEASLDLGLVLIGPQGGGKTMFATIVSEMFAPYRKILTSRALDADFNGWVETSLCVVMNEAKGRRLRDSMDRLKSLITDRRQPVNEKYRAERDCDTYAFYIFTSNETNAGAFAHDDRRMIVWGMPDKHPKGDAFYEDIYKWWREQDGPAKLLHYAQNYDLEGWSPPKHAPTTRQKQMAYYASLSPIQRVGDMMRTADENIVAQWIAASLSWATSEGANNAPALAAEIQDTMVHMPVRSFYTADELARIFPAISANILSGRVKDMTPENVLMNELLDIGIDYLRCSDNYDGFMYKGQVRQYLVVADHEDFKDPITQEEFDYLMENFPTYRQYRALRKNKRKKSG